MTYFKPALILTCALTLAACEETTAPAASNQGSGQIVVRADGSIVDQTGGQVVLPDGGIIIEQAGGPPAPQASGQIVQQASAPPPAAPRQTRGPANCARVVGYTVSNGQRLAMIDSGGNTFFTPFDTIPNNPNVCPFNEAELDRIQI